MFDHFWPRIEDLWPLRQKTDKTTPSEHRQDVEHDNEFRCWNCGEFIDIYAEVCPFCGHSPDPAIEDFTKKIGE